ADVVLDWGRKYRDYLGLSRENAHFIIDGEWVYLLLLVHKFRRAYDPEIPTIFCRRVFGLILRNLYSFEGLIETPFHRGQAKLIRIVEQMENRVNLAWIILGETIRLLNARKTDPAFLMPGHLVSYRFGLPKGLG
ncbi:hypothetical protein KSS87_012207, partial [Heliosperma pusillum]